MLDVTFVATLIAMVSLGGCLVLSLVRPALRIWPPPGRNLLVDAGPYRFTRNPQYVGDIAILLDWGVLANSLHAWVLCIFAMGWFALAPFAEEPWLREQYGEAYDAYRQCVPRSLGRRRGASG